MKEKLAKDPYNVVITGVGGQGNVMASRVLSNMLVRKGFRVTIGETFGMSQRGGSVMSHIRVSSSAVWSPQIPKGRADLIVAIEPLEAMRVLETIREAVEALSEKACFLDATAEAIRLGNPILGNIVMIGAVAGLGVLPVDPERFAEVIRETMPASRIEANLEAFRIGAAAVA
jgi:indolepyruvate ferredoxin oxidoreductase beta subunit